MTPETFEQQLDHRLGGHYRLRWSNATATWCIEQKVDRAFEVPLDGDPDITARVQDGYALVLRFSPTPTMHCPQCRSELQIPVLSIGEVVCTYCKAKPSETHDNMLWYTGYFPLCDALITHLERTSAKREGKWVAEMAASNRRVAEQRDTLYRNKMGDIASDYWKQAANIQQVGAGNGPASHGRL